MNYEISDARLEEQKAEFGFVREEAYAGLSGGSMIEYVGAFGVFAMKLGGKIWSCEA